jgi:hypothetical protein
LTPKASPDAPALPLMPHRKTRITALERGDLWVIITLAL